MAGQVGLFGGQEPTPGRVGPAVVPDALRAVADRLPETLHLGTSSWTFPGWTGLVYDRPATPAVLARDEGLAAYARHPLFRTVGVDRTHYRPVDAERFAGWRRAVPDDFRFLVKAHDHCTLATFPRHPRHGEQGGRPNARFLDPGYAVDQVVGPWRQGLGRSAGPLLFQFAPQDIDAMGGPWGFAERLHAFLAALPPLRAGQGPFYAVEVRNPALLTPAYADVLAAHGAVHCLTVHGAMPGLRTQWRLAGCGRQGAVVVRWMLRRALSYEVARARYAPFDRLVDPDPETRSDLARLARAMADRLLPTWIVANNKAEGCSPRTLAALAEAVPGTA
ncbi:MAG: DUF72 domain-containing protein [Alphaproteobacteria bacterium]|nr:DUF72 domain-containing protein [Alphaproteobacteria bacterium]